METETETETDGELESSLGVLNLSALDYEILGIVSRDLDRCKISIYAAARSTFAPQIYSRSCQLEGEVES